MLSTRERRGALIFATAIAMVITASRSAQASALSHGSPTPTTTDATEASKVHPTQTTLALETELAKVTAHFDAGEKPKPSFRSDEIIGGICYSGGKTVASLLLQNSDSHPGLAIVKKETPTAEASWEKSVALRQAYQKLRRLERRRSQSRMIIEDDDYADEVNGPFAIAGTAIAPARINRGRRSYPRYDQETQRKIRRLRAFIEDTNDDLETLAEDHWDKQVPPAKGLSQKDPKSMVFFGAALGAEKSDGEPEIIGSNRYEVRYRDGEYLVRSTTRKNTDVFTDYCVYPDPERELKKYRPRHRPSEYVDFEGCECDHPGYPV